MADGIFGHLSGARWAVRGVRFPFSHRSPAPRTRDGAQHTAHHHVQIRDDEGGYGALHRASFPEFATRQRRQVGADVVVDGDDESAVGAQLGGEVRDLFGARLKSSEMPPVSMWMCRMRRGVRATASRRGRPASIAWAGRDITAPIARSVYGARGRTAQRGRRRRSGRSTGWRCSRPRLGAGRSARQACVSAPPPWQRRPVWRNRRIRRPRAEAAMEPQGVRGDGRDERGAVAALRVSLERQQRRADEREVGRVRRDRGRQRRIDLRVCASRTRIPVRRCRDRRDPRSRESPRAAGRTPPCAPGSAPGAWPRWSVAAVPVPRRATRPRRSPPRPWTARRSATAWRRSGPRDDSAPDTGSVRPSRTKTVCRDLIDLSGTPAVAAWTNWPSNWPPNTRL